MTATKDLMLSSRTDIELGRFYSGALAVATQLAIPWTRRTSFASRAELIRECEELNDTIEKVRATIRGSADEQTGSPGLRRLRNSPQAEAIRQQTLADNSAARREAASRIQRETETMMSDTAATDTGAPNGAAPPAAKKAKKAAKKAASPKKSAKSAKKAAPKKAVKSAATGRSAAVPGTAKITIKVKENPRRKGTTQYERFDKLMKFGGKTVEEFMAKGGDRNALNLALSREEISVK